MLELFRSAIGALLIPHLRQAGVTEGSRARAPMLLVRGGDGGAVPGLLAACAIAHIPLASTAR